jgi:hypothetical protein
MMIDMIWWLCRMIMPVYEKFTLFSKLCFLIKLKGQINRKEFCVAGTATGRRQSCE